MNDCSIVRSFQFKKLSKVVKEDEPQPSTSNISLNDELEIIPSTSTLTTTITPVDEDITGAIGQDHLNDYNEFMMMNNEQEPEEESDGDDSENIEIPDFFLNPKNLKGKIKCSLHFFSADLICIDYEEEVGGNKSKNEALFINSLMASELKTFYYDFLLDINSTRYQENINMQSIIKLVPMIIKHCLDVLPNDIKDYSSYHNYSTKLPAILIN